MSRRAAARPKTNAPAARSAVQPQGERQVAAGIWQAGNSAVARMIGQMERSIGEDLSGVKIHSDPQAAEKASALGAVAFTRGNDIFLGAQTPSPATEDGRRLLAHELTHVVQQRKASSVDPSRVNEPGDSYEHAADQTAGLAMQGQAAIVGGGGGVPGVQRDLPKLNPGVDMASAVFGRVDPEVKLREFFDNGPKDKDGNVDIAKVRSSILQLANGVKATERFTTSMALAQVLNSPIVQKKPALLAKSIAAALPKSFDTGALMGLHIASSGPKQTLAEKGVAALAAGTDKNAAPGTPEVAPNYGPSDLSNKGSYIAGKDPKSPTTVPIPASDIGQAIADKIKGDKKPDAQPSNEPDKGTVGLKEVTAAIQYALTMGKTTAELYLPDNLFVELPAVIEQAESALQAQAVNKGKITAIRIHTGSGVVRTITARGKK